MVNISVSQVFEKLCNLSRDGNSDVPLVLNLALELLVVINEILERKLYALLQLRDCKIFVLLGSFLACDERLHPLENEESESLEVAFHQFLMESD